MCETRFLERVRKLTSWALCLQRAPARFAKLKFWTESMASSSSPDLDDKTLKRYISEQPKGLECNISICGREDRNPTLQCSRFLNLIQPWLRLPQPQHEQVGVAYKVPAKNVNHDTVTPNRWHIGTRKSSGTWVIFYERSEHC